MLDSPIVFMTKCLQLFIKLLISLFQAFGQMMSDKQVFTLLKWWEIKICLQAFWLVSCYNSLILIGWYGHWTSLFGPGCTKFRVIGDAEIEEFQKTRNNCLNKKIFVWNSLPRPRMFPQEKNFLQNSFHYSHSPLGNEWLIVSISEVFVTESNTD